MAYQHLIYTLGYLIVPCVSDLLFRNIEELVTFRVMIFLYSFVITF